MWELINWSLQNLTTNNLLENKINQKTKNDGGIIYEGR